jgi:hypothetical protein
LSATDGSTDRSLSQRARWAALLAAAPTSVELVLRAIAGVDSITERTAGLVAALISDPIGFVREVVAATVVNTVLTLAAGLLNAVVTTFLGSDGAIGQQGDSTLGLLDLPVVAVTTGTSAARAGFGGLLGAVVRINAYIAAAFADFGLAALPVATALALIEVAVGLYVAWVGIQAAATAADLTGFPLVAGLDSVLEFLGTLFAPLQRFLAEVFGDG